MNVTLGEALERVRQDIERLLRNEGLVDYFSIYIDAWPLSCECEGGEE